jgi:hypothetical protein
VDHFEVEINNIKFPDTAAHMPEKYGPLNFDSQVQLQVMLAALAVNWRIVEAPMSLL